MATTLGTVSIFDLTENSNESIWIPAYENEEGQKYKFIEPTFTTDGMEQLVHT